MNEKTQDVNPPVETQQPPAANTNSAVPEVTAPDTPNVPAEQATPGQGESVITQTSPDGTVSTITTSPDGTMTTVTKKPDGSEQTMTVSPDGNVSMHTTDGANGDASMEHSTSMDVASSGSYGMDGTTMYVLMTVLMIVSTFKILQRVGMQPLLSLLCLIPFVGMIIVMCMLAFGEWKLKR